MTLPEEQIQSVKRRFSIIGNAPQLNLAITRALRVAPTALSVLILGENGVGKESFPRIIHENSPNKHNKYIAVNCGSIPEGTIDSELFGHKKGAFTDATSDHKGYFEEADGGTIFLDEVGEMPLSTQARLLRVLENGEIIRMGENTPRKIRIRVVAATNKDVLQAIREGRFREDLYHRLASVVIHVPPLRERGEEDLQLLVRKFQNDFEQNANKDFQRAKITDDAIKCLAAYSWPGNIRQLRNIVQQISIFEAGNTVDADIVKTYLPKEDKPNLPAPAAASKSDYNREREVIFMLFNQLKQEIDQIKAIIVNDGGHLRVNANVRELERSLHSWEQHNEYGADDEPTLLHHSGKTMPENYEVNEVTATVVGDNHSNHIKTLEETERDLIEDTLSRNNGRRKITAKQLNISERTLYRKIKQYGLERK